VTALDVMTNAPRTLGRLVLGIIVAAGTMLFSASTVSADLSPPISFYNLWDGVTTTFITNLPVNLFWLSLALYMMGLAVREELGVVPTSKWTLMGGLAASVLVITVLGTAIDITFLYEHNGEYILTANLEGWTVAAILIFASVYLTVLLVMKVDRVFSMVPAVVMMSANVLWWSVLGSNSATGALPLLMGLVCLALSPLPLAGLLAWHTRMVHAHTQRA